MAEKSKIEWTDATWNPVTGCSVVSPGCTNCYAMKLAGTRLTHHASREGLTMETKAGPVWNGEVRFNDQWLYLPLRWRKPRRIFVCAHGDLFHESVPDEWIDMVFAVMALCPQHTFQVLTKRARRMREYMTASDVQERIETYITHFALELTDPHSRQRDDLRATAADLFEEGAWVLPNVWLGVSAEDQKRADERIPDLLATPAAVRFVSAEPLLGPIDLECVHANNQDTNGEEQWNSLDRVEAAWSVKEGGPGGVIDWVIVGGESGMGARPMHLDWARSLRDQCAGAGVPFFLKQLGSFKTVYDRDREDPDWRRCDVIERETPSGRWLNLEGGHGFHGERVLRVVPMKKYFVGALLDGREHNELPEPVIAIDAAPRCRVCGCMEFSACLTEDGPCYWAEPDLCSACVGKEEGEGA